MEAEAVMQQSSSASLHGPGRNSTIICYPTKSVVYGIFLGDNPLKFIFPSLLLQVSVVFIATRVTTFLLKPLKQPSIVSDVLGGILLGPSFLGRSKAFENAVFPERTRHINETIASFGIMFHVFVAGVKMNPGLIKRATKNEVIMSLMGLMSSILLSKLALIIFGMDPPQELGTQRIIGNIHWVFSITFFTVLSWLLEELKFLNTEIGRTALRCSLIVDMVNCILLTVRVYFTESKGDNVRAFWSVMTCAAFMLVVVGVARPVLLYVIDRTEQEQKMNETVIYYVLVLVLVTSLISEIIGQRALFGAFILGLSIPNGPPLGTALVEKINSFTSYCFLPLFFASTGLKTDIYQIRDFNVYGFLAVIALFSTIGKVVSYVCTSIYLNIPIRDAFTLAFLMCTKGLLDLLSFTVLRDAGFINEQVFGVLVLLMLAVAAITTPLACYSFVSSRKYAEALRKGDLNSSKYDSELRILACVHDENNVPSIINLLEISNASKRSPITIYVLQVVELVGRASPLLVAYKPRKATFKPTTTDHIANALRKYDTRQNGNASVHLFTAIAPYTTMHEDVYALATNHRTSLIIIPFHRRSIAIDLEMEEGHNIQVFNQRVLSTARCSVGILIDRRAINYCMLPNPRISYQVAMLFLGGKDDREMLAYAERMVENPDVYMLVVRCVLPDGIDDGNPTEATLDNNAMDQFFFKCMDNERVVYREEESKDGEGTVSAIISMGDMFDLFMVGRGPDRETPFTLGLSEWKECKELGAIGDFLASTDYKGTLAVLVVQQQSQSSTGRSGTRPVQVFPLT